MCFSFILNLFFMFFPLVSCFFCVVSFLGASFGYVLGIFYLIFF